MVEPINLLFPVAGIVLLGGGVALVRKGRFYAKQTARIADTDVSDVGSLRRGTVAVEGTARAADGVGTTTTELTGEDALVSRSEVVAKEERAGGADEDDERERHVLHEAQHAVPFLVEDDTGSVRVDPPDEADVRLDHNKVTKRSRGVPSVADLAENPAAAGAGEIGIGDTPNWKDHDRRYEQGALVPGEEVYILGEAVDSTGGGLAIGGGESPRHFIVSDTGPESAKIGGKIGAYIAYLMGGFMGLIGVLLLFGGLSVLL